ncbi:MAG: JAB domain-containing protein [Crocinitomicaceae bacterium]|nr:JAB domain-containing protein [Crocinitomicaceae bacterium]MBP6032656.1 JAB domain-containing protein [Crocinitomicaceae bacterium]
MKYLKELQVKYTPSKKVYKNERITNSELAFQYVRDTFNHETIACQEQFNVLFINHAHLPIGYYKASVGSNTATVVDIKLLMGLAIKSLSSGIIIAHNHPSGNLQPSENDIQLTKKIKDACALFDINLLDHLILSPCGGKYSFADNSKL